MEHHYKYVGSWFKFTPRTISLMGLHVNVFIRLGLSNNHFTGSIPRCLKNSTSLRHLNLRNNSLTETLVGFNSSGLRSLDVSRNTLVGKLTKSLINCELDLLNVGGNKIKDTFPFWLESMTVLVLQSNEFYGPVYNPSSAHLTFQNLRVIDISNNNFVGSLPQDYFANFPLMSEVWVGKGEYMLDYLHDYDDSVDLVDKGIDMDFVQIRFDFKAVDFSGNRYFGHIPGSVGLMSSMRLLNMSGNAFTGNIPPSLANITTLEALDLSGNNLSRKIPQGLGNLSFLSHINFSHNHLVGLVPQTRSLKLKTVLHSWVILESMASRQFVEKSMSPFLHCSGSPSNLCRRRKSRC